MKRRRGRPRDPNRLKRQTDIVVETCIKTNLLGKQAAAVADVRTRRKISRATVMRALRVVLGPKTEEKRRQFVYFRTELSFAIFPCRPWSVRLTCDPRYLKPINCPTFETDSSTVMGLIEHRTT
jgi:hypothetical protein